MAMRQAHRVSDPPVRESSHPETGSYLLEKPSITHFLRLYRLSPMERIDLILRGVPAAEAKEVAKRMDVAQDAMFKVLRLPISTVNKRAARNQELTIEESERLVGMASLIGQVESMMAESGEAEDFDAAKWLGQWMETPNPALGQRRPAEFLCTAEGFRLVSDVLAAMQSGAYL
ncbi:antitoxin Xre/MbcA/ParS toxin-binding domain-containing protein [Chromobacterium sp. IIBBL 290-4]|uniref:type II RES/Xre toxin-antitoxin system antitoxin n=1 Tax=Chromobacterium sp. IIBBL 290-4 TaxID=2953890 RepID=UPI0020B69EDC|nr:antitoxin Xre/MbcA/ParS toxin-binding domain-containing protein [Chromobacterium sp. IIBBL 290-4]UTH72330.1 DUF2384 domain-containing protein [Chromobacterium sp. IIBBL 290-4]